MPVCCGFLAIAHLISYDRTAGSSCICRNNDTAFEQTSYNGGSCACGLWERDTLCVEGSISCVVGKVEASHVGGLMVLLLGRWYSEV